MRLFLDFLAFLFASRDPATDHETFGEFADKREQARRLHHIVHKAKTEWLFSGTIRSDNGVISDGGFLRSPYAMRRAQALDYFVRTFPHGKIVHVDDKNKIITYSF